MLGLSAFLPVLSPAAIRVRSDRPKITARICKWIVLCGTVGWLAACQTPAQDLSAEAPVPTVDGSPVASNELSRLGRQDLAAGNSGLAEQHFRDAIEKNRNDVSAWIGLAAAYDDLKRFDLADRAYAQAIKLQGETFDIVNNQGYSYLLRGDRTRALSRLRRAAEMQPDNSVVLNNLRLLESGDQANRHAAP